MLFITGVPRRVRFPPHTMIRSLVKLKLSFFPLFLVPSFLSTIYVLSLPPFFFFLPSVFLPHTYHPLFNPFFTHSSTLISRHASSHSPISVFSTCVISLTMFFSLLASLSSVMTSFYRTHFLTLSPQQLCHPSLTFPPHFPPSFYLSSSHPPSLPLPSAVATPFITYS